MQDRPTVHELLDAVRRFLEEEIVPATEGRRQFLARVAANSLAIVERELATEEEQTRREWDGLGRLLSPEPYPATREERYAAIHRRVEELCARIRAGEADGTVWGRDVLAHTRAVVRDKLSVTNPAYVDG